jgi:hypothetical protein
MRYGRDENAKQRTDIDLTRLCFGLGEKKPYCGKRTNQRGGLHKRERLA